jgi:hypothetical protein
MQVKSGKQHIAFCGAKIAKIQLLIFTGIH